MKTARKCSECDGKGMVGLDTEIDYRVCPLCNGTGRIENECLKK